MLEPVEKIWMDGKLVPWADANVHILTHSLHYGLAAFEGIRCYKGKSGSAIFRLQEHVDRLFESAHIGMMEMPYDRKQIAEAIVETVRANRLDACYIRPLVYIGYGAMGVHPGNNPIRVAIAAWRWGSYLGDDALAAAVRASSPGPAFFVQPRVGRRGRMFGCVKLRTMRVDADEHLRDLLARNPELRREFNRDFKLRNDPRITRIGRVLRITGLDELPQLLAVLSGEMSLVGPRPVVPEETAYYGPYLELVQSLRPGLTGLWQVSGRNDIPYEERVALDVEYALTRTLRGDVGIILRTILLAFRPGERGAY